jgi:hypothetical protein
VLKAPNVEGRERARDEACCADARTNRIPTDGIASRSFRCRDAGWFSPTVGVFADVCLKYPLVCDVYGDKYVYNASIFMYSRGDARVRSVGRRVVPLRAAGWFMYGF